MKTITSLLLGLLSSALLSIGLTRAAGACDPHLRHPALVAASTAHPTDGCDQACSYLQ